MTAAKVRPATAPGRCTTGSATLQLTTNRAILQQFMDGVGAFVIDGVAGAIERAERAAGNKLVYLFGAAVLQQALPLGLVDEIHVHVVAVLIGAGTPLFGSLDTGIPLERTNASTTPAATHLKFRVLR